MPDTVQLTELQIAIMRVLWARGEATVADICAELQSERGLALTTIATVLSRLEKRGVVTHETRARQFVYRPLVSEADVRQSMLEELTEQFFSGNVADLMTHLISEREISPGDLERLKAMLEDRTTKKGGPEHAR